MSFIQCEYAYMLAARAHVSKKCSNTYLKHLKHTKNLKSQDCSNACLKHIKLKTCLKQNCLKQCLTCFKVFEHI